MANQWVRLWVDMPNDPKWRTIARASSQPISAVIAVYVHLLTLAANAPERGRTQLNAEDLGSALDMETACVESIFSAMQGRVLDGDKLTGWEIRQPKREDDSASRSKAWREAKKASNEEKDKPNAPERKRTLDKDKDKDKEEKKNKRLSSDKSDNTPKGFASFWDAWPKTARKTGKAECCKRWVKRDLEPLAEKIVAHVEGMKKTEQWRTGFEPAPLTYINQKRWEDDLPPRLAVVGDPFAGAI